MIENNEGCSKLFAGGSLAGFIIIAVIVVGAAISAWGAEGIFMGLGILLLIFVVSIFLFG